MSKGFTLVELLIVIAILGVLSAAVVLVLNPAELLEQSRDSTRVTDLSALHRAIALYITDAVSPDMDTLENCAVNTFSNAIITTYTFSGGSSKVIASRAINGTGWLPINFSAIAGGSPLGTLPADIVNSGDYVYRYACNNSAKTFELNAYLESEKYATNFDFDGRDGGTHPGVYEVGNEPGLDL